jgi:hypothetical protein
MLTAFNEQDDKMESALEYKEFPYAPFDPWLSE